MIEDGLGKNISLWRRVALQGVGILEKRIRGVPGIHVPAPDWTMYLLLPSLTAL